MVVLTIQIVEVVGKGLSVGAIQDNATQTPRERELADKLMFVLYGPLAKSMEPKGPAQLISADSLAFVPMLEGALTKAGIPFKGTALELAVKRHKATKRKLRTKK